MVLLTMIQWDYDFIWRVAYRVYPIVPYAVLAIWLALGLAWMGEVIDEAERRINSQSAEIAESSPA